MDLDKYFEIEQDRRKEVLYNYLKKYVNHYNKNSVAAQGDFSKLMERLEKRDNTNLRRIGKLIDQFVEDFKEISEKAIDEQKTDLSSPTLIFCREKVLSTIEDIKEISDEFYPDVTVSIEEAKKYASMVLRAAMGQNVNTESNSLINLLEKIGASYKELLDTRIHATAVIYVSNKAFDEGSPDKLSLNAMVELLDIENEGLDEKELNKGGRPPTFDIKDTGKWFKELEKKSAYQWPSGKPNIGKITQEIISRHRKKTQLVPSEATITTHRRELGLMQE